MQLVVALAVWATQRAATAVATAENACGAPVTLNSASSECALGRAARGPLV
jgi:hypothetical protein